MEIKLGEYMAKKGMNQRQLSEASGVPQPMISQIKTGDVPNPTIGTLYKLALALECTVDELIDKERKENKDE